MAEKNRQHQTCVVSLLTIFLWFLMMLGSISAEEASSAREAEDATLSRSEKVSVFVDKTTLKEGESLKLVVQCQLPYILLSEPEILLSDSLSRPQSKVDSAVRKEYIIKANKTGKYNIQVRVKYKTSTSEDAPSGTAILEVRNIDVQKGNSLGFLKTIVGLIPIVVGAVLGFTVSLGTSAFNAWREQRKKEKWILNSLLPQLRVAQSDIAKGEPVGYEIWMREFYEGGYYSALQKLSERLEEKPDLCSDMVTIHSLLKSYERELGKVEMSEEVCCKLDKNLFKVIEALSKC